MTNEILSFVSVLRQNMYELRGLLRELIDFVKTHLS